MFNINQHDKFQMTRVYQHCCLKLAIPQLKANFISGRGKWYCSSLYCGLLSVLACPGRITAASEAGSTQELQC
ncbi:MAG: hypothetical protein CML20_11410 [Rheinheimera sp.]|nr:hypothetical protein [Rheinheimera sp.]